MSVLAVTDASFKKEVLEAELPVLVDFWAAWCGPCRMVSPVVDAIGQEYTGKLKVCKLNVDENPAIAQGYGIMSIPTLMVFKNGQVAKTLVGFRSKEMLVQELQGLL